MTMPTELHPQYVVDEHGEKVSVVLSIDEFEQILEDVEDMAVALERKDEKTIPHDALLLDTFFDRYHLEVGSFNRGKAHAR